jgi:hypothetical protein
VILNNFLSKMSEREQDAPTLSSATALGANKVPVVTAEEKKEAIEPSDAPGKFSEESCDEAASPSDQQIPLSRAPAASSLTTRQGLHDKLRAYEARRRLAYASKFESSSLHWKSFRDLLAASVQETGRAQRLVLGTSRAHQLYADGLQAMYEDIFLDERGNVILKPKQQKKLSMTRKLPERKLSSNADESGPARGSCLIPIREAQHVMAERFGENARNMDVEIADEIGHLFDELKVKVGNMELLGDAILAELEETEQEVAEAWGT